MYVDNKITYTKQKIEPAKMSQISYKHVCMLFGAKSFSFEFFLHDFRMKINLHEYYLNHFSMTMMMMCVYTCTYKI